jgi:hypothetical protein
MARIQGLPAERAGLLVRFAYWFTRRKFRTVVEPLTIAAHNGAIFQGYSAFEFALTRAHAVPERLKTLASIKAGALVGCPF